MTARNTWKAAERRIAEDLGGKRIPVTGIDRHGADVVTPMFHVQVKLRKALPAWLWDWLAGIRGTAKAVDKVGVLILKRPRQRDCDGLVVMSYADFIDLHGRACINGHTWRRAEAEWTGSEDRIGVPCDCGETTWQVQDLR